ncbi:Uncharacterized protein ChrSV_3038 [Chromobacterium vaccinii]|nr:Uncharacterized protein ChrSW_3038 [Chromobacterium vaccinii]QND90495.1 Uncharacterized protein ChrSV_3038 [Chromobacterium vaccinii]
MLMSGGHLYSIDIFSSQCHSLSGRSLREGRLAHAGLVYFRLVRPGIGQVAVYFGMISIFLRTSNQQ